MTDQPQTQPQSRTKVYQEYMRQWREAVEALRTERRKHHPNPLRIQVLIYNKGVIEGLLREFNGDDPGDEMALPG